MGKRRSNGESLKVTKEGEVNCKDKTIEDNAWTSVRLFPEYGIHLLVFIVLVTRLGIANDKANWWTLHPDEHYQAIEVAHSEVYGYGFRSYEYYSVEKDGLPLDSEANLARHIAIGMHGTKSWITVRFYSAALQLKEWTGIKTRPYQYLKIIHTTIAALLPMIIFLLMRHLETDYSLDVATVSSALVAFSDYFVLLGTHTIIETITSTFTFLGIALFYTNQKIPQDDNMITETIDGNGNVSNNRHLNSKSIKKEEKFELSNDESLGLLTEFKMFLKLILSGFLVGITSYADPKTLIVFPVVYICFLMYSYNTCCVIPRPVTFLAFSTGVFISIMLGGLDDFLSYGVWFETPFRWWNFWTRQAGSVYGASDEYFYVNYVISSPMILAQLCTTVFALGLFLFCRFGSLVTLRQWTDRSRNIIQLTISLFVGSVTMVALHSCLPHKDVRFIHDAIVILACSSGCASFALFKFLRMLLLEEKQEKLVIALKLLIFAEVLMGVIRCSSGYPSARNLVLRDNQLVPEQYWESIHVADCTEFVGKQSDVTGVVIDHSIHQTAGTTLLNLNVPILAKTYHDFREWGLDKQVKIQGKSYSAANNSVSLWTFDSVSNFFAEESGLLVLRHVIENPHYNYAILTKNRRFPKAGFRELYRSGNTTVFKRMKSRKAVEELKHLASKVQAKNSTILAYETGWLIAFELFNEAANRAQIAVDLDPKCGLCWQLLYTSVKHLDETKAKKIMTKCYGVISKELCTKRYKRIILHQEYGFGLTTPQTVRSRTS